MYWTYGFGWQRLIFGGLGMLIFWGLLILLAVLLVRLLMRPAPAHAGGASGSSANAPDRALEILRERYARGEITKEQFDGMRRDLQT